MIFKVLSILLKITDCNNEFKKLKVLVLRNNVPPRIIRKLIKSKHKKTIKLIYLKIKNDTDNNTCCTLTCFSQLSQKVATILSKITVRYF